MKKLFQTSLPLLAISLTLYSPIASVQAQSYPTKNPWQISQTFKPPIGRNDPNPVTTGGATRGSSCLKENTKIIPLVPVNKLGLSVNSHPTFHVYLPSSSVKTAEFVIRNDADPEIFYQTTVTLPNQAGIVSLSLPTDLPPLKLDTTYHWFFTVVCDSQDSSKNPFIEGWVQRIKPDSSLSATIAKADLRKQTTIYAEAGIWYDALTNLVQLRRTEPNNLKLKMNWQQLLDSVGLNDIVSEPLIDLQLVNN
ncbi:DUF928 domain-containing protein [Cronbergia sp. UHCC 0137]|uniref:DUF928 domain-containing protein n=1 Tax=Cronbergia sp. UHCC 0137 TaxID=3110239 RepID=UPI002B221915|nr:DUF928 domain-containing protein [Cronbergia sp. UHCC 0137]MEA5621210.1 DUF928 domain-containing protein [Cronbergia sp. UHCC 0137]